MRPTLWTYHDDGAAMWRAVGDLTADVAGATMTISDEDGFICQHTYVSHDWAVRSANAILQTCAHAPPLQAIRVKASGNITRRSWSWDIDGRRFAPREMVVIHDGTHARWVGTVGSTSAWHVTVRGLVALKEPLECKPRRVMTHAVSVAIRARHPFSRRNVVV